MTEIKESQRAEMRADQAAAKSQWYSDISTPDVSGGKPVEQEHRSQDKTHAPKYSLHTSSHHDHPLYWIRHEYIAVVFSLIGTSTAYMLNYIPYSSMRIYNIFIRLLYYSTLSFGLFSGLTAMIWFYQTTYQPHPHWNHPPVDRPTDPGGDELLRTGIPKEHNRKTGQDIVEPPLHNFTLLKLIYAPHKNYYIDKFFEHVAWVVSYMIPIVAQIMAKLYWERWYSRYQINSFCSKFGIKLDDFIVPDGGFATFQAFFTREVRKDRRPIASPDDDTVISAPADCRLLVFENVQDIVDMSFKGEHMNLERMVGPDLQHEWTKPEDLSMILCRPGIEDYHRFHMPMQGKFVYDKTVDFRQQAIAGEGSMLGFTELPYSHRKILLFDDSPVGKFVYIPFGATIVNSIVLKHTIGTTLKRGDEVGYFKYGSNVIFLFKRGTVEFDKDIIKNTELHTETRVIMGTKIGRVIKKSQ